MIRELADVLGMDESSLHSAFHEAARRAGRVPGAVVISNARDVMGIPSDNNIYYNYVPMPESVTIIYGPKEKVGKASWAAKETLT